MQTEKRAESAHFCIAGSDFVGRTTVFPETNFKAEIVTLSGRHVMGVDKGVCPFNQILSTTLDTPKATGKGVAMPRKPRFYPRSFLWDFDCRKRSRAPEVARYSRAAQIGTPLGNDHFREQIECVLDCRAGQPIGNMSFPNYPLHASPVGGQRLIKTIL